MGNYAKIGRVGPWEGKLKCRGHVSSCFRAVFLLQKHLIFRIVLARAFGTRKYLCSLRVLRGAQKPLARKRVLLERLQRLHRSELNKIVFLPKIDIQCTKLSPYASVPAHIVFLSRTQNCALLRPPF